MFVYFSHSLTISHSYILLSQPNPSINIKCFPVAQMVEHGTSNAKIMGSIPRESKS